MTRKRKVAPEKREVFLLFIMVLCAVFLAEYGEAVTAGSVEIKGLNSIREDEFLDMFCTKKGSPVTGEGVRESIKRVFLKDCLKIFPRKYRRVKIPP